ncbi:peptidase C39 family protein [Candidatus Woesearchaeota archaeon]|nr:peptidase C39 family protein [Candidatus Woesearchaeota archaeon]
MQHYKQTTKYTCAAASLAMIINHFKPEFKLNQENEFDIWHKSAALPVLGSSIYGLALYANQNGIPALVVVGEKEFKFPGYKFKAYKKAEVDMAARSTKYYLDKVERAGMVVEQREFTLKEVKNLLAQGKVILLRLVVGIIRGTKDNKRNPHYLPVFGYKDGKFTIVDPKMGKLDVDEAVVQEAFDKILELKRDPRMIVFG